MMEMRIPKHYGIVMINNDEKAFRGLGSGFVEI